MPVREREASEFEREREGKQEAKAFESEVKILKWTSTRHPADCRRHCRRHCRRYCRWPYTSAEVEVEACHHPELQVMWQHPRAPQRNVREDCLELLAHV